MSGHVTLKVIGSASPTQQLMVKVHSGPTVNCAHEPWACGQCASYASRDNIYRVISKDCGEHACLIPAAVSAPPAAPLVPRKPRRPRKTTGKTLPVVPPELDLPKRDLARVCEQSVRYPTGLAAAGRASKGQAICHCSRCGGFHLTPLRHGGKR